MMAHGAAVDSRRQPAADLSCTTSDGVIAQNRDNGRSHHPNSWSTIHTLYLLSILSFQSTTNSATTIPQHKQYLCHEVDCNESFSHPSGYKRHRVTHYPSGQFACPHNEYSCTHTFKRGDRLKAHYEKDHPGDIFDGAAPLRRAQLADKKRWACRICIYGPKPDGFNFTYEEAEQHDLDHLTEGRTKHDGSSFFHALNLLTYSSIHHYWLHYLGPSFKPRQGTNDDAALLALVKDLEVEGPGRCRDQALAARAADLLLIRLDNINVLQTIAPLHAIYLATPTASPLAYSPPAPEQTNEPAHFYAPYLPAKAAPRWSNYAYSQTGSLNDSSNPIHTLQLHSNDPSYTAAQLPAATQSSTDCAIRPGTEASDPLRQSYFSARSSIPGPSTHLLNNGPTCYSTLQPPFTTPSISYVPRSENAPIAGSSTPRTDGNPFSDTHRPSLGASYHSVYPPSTVPATSNASRLQDVMTPGSSISSMGRSHAYTCPPNLGARAPPAYSPPVPAFVTSINPHHRMTRTPSSGNPLPPAHAPRWGLPTSRTSSLSLECNALNQLAVTSEAEEPPENAGSYSVKNYLQENHSSHWTQLHPRSDGNLDTQLDDSIIDSMGSGYPNYTRNGTQGSDDHYPGVD